MKTASKSGRPAKSGKVAIARAARKSSAASTPARRLILRARTIMADRGFRSVSALQRSLATIGVAISVPQLIRVVDGEARHINKDVIEGMLTVFQCGVADLFVMV